MNDKGPVVLVVEDNEATRYAVTRILAGAGFRVRAVGTGAAAVEALSEQRPDLIILDVLLPDTSGFDLCRHIRRDPSICETPVMHLSASRVGAADRVKGLEGGADAYLIHPVDPGVLVATVKALLRARSAERGRAEALEEARSALERERAAREDSERAREELTRVLGAREEALAVVSHDLKNPLEAILLSAGQLAKGLERGDPQDKNLHRIDAIRRAAIRMSELISTLLDLARLESGRFPLAIRPEDAGELVTEAVALHAPFARERAIPLQAQAPERRVAVACDKNRVYQVFGNLVVNAIKHGGGAVEVGAGLRSGEALFWVSDQGPGIPPEQLPRIFERYWQARATGQGAGLGLSIAKGIVEVHGGRIWAESQVGRGTRFLFTLPLA